MQTYKRLGTDTLALAQHHRLARPGLCPPLSRYAARLYQQWPKLRCPTEAHALLTVQSAAELLILAEGVANDLLQQK